ncbi:WD repeat domain-containing protein 83-like [Uloborus diversus]|uniref:WD repeat domain-containing protein 83-like n=1 Tax=Uloborus diversus TaxID=327109 RepID=UPI002409B814|nr:WD repeat domain-containing protein 83-like [Uloborus diversus]
MGLPNVLNKQLSCKQGAVRAVRFNVDGNYCLTAGSDKSVKLWNPHKSVLLHTYMGHGYEVLDVQASCDSAHIASGGMDKSVFYWDVSTGQIVRKFRGHAGYVNAVKFNEQSTIILSASIDNSVCAWDCRSKSREPAQIMRDAKDSVTSISVSDHEILTASLDHCIRCYDLRTGKLHTDDLGCSLNCVTFTKDGQCILVSCLDNTLRLMDKSSGEILSEYEGHKNESYRIESCLNDTDTHVVSGSEDGKVYFWDLIEGTVAEKLNHQGHKVVHSISFHPTKPILLTAAEANIYLWKENNEEDEKEE